MNCANVVEGANARKVAAWRVALESLLAASLIRESGDGRYSLTSAGYAEAAKLGAK